MSDLCQIKKDFSQLVLQVPQWTLTQFMLWLDLKVAEYKVNGYMVLDDTNRTLPRWIDDDVLEVQETAPKHRHRRPCGHGHGKRRRKWRRRHEWGMPFGLDKAHHKAEGTMNTVDNQDNTFEISDESSDSDFEYVNVEIPHVASAPAGNCPQRQPTENFPHPHWFTKLSSDLSLKVPKPINSTKRCSTDSVVENVNQVSISNDQVRHKHSLMDNPLCQLRNNSPFLIGDNSSRNTSGTCTPERCQAEETEKTVTSTASAAPASVNKSSVPDGENREKSPETEAMVTQDSEEVVDVKPDIVLLDDKEGEGQDEKEENKDDNKLEIDVELLPLSPVTSALMTYQGEKHCKRRSECPLESLAKRQTNVIPDLLDNTTKRYLQAGHSKLVWNKVVAACASFLVHTCRGQPSSSDYKWLCKTMYDKYPALGSIKGPNPWSNFNRAVSQKIRYTRYKIRQLSKTPPVTLPT